MTRNYRYKSKPSIHDPRLGPYDILCGRTSHAYNNVGNRRFRVTIRMFLERYQRLHSRADRKVFIYYLTKLCRDEIGFRFLKKESGDFHDIGEVETRKKIGHALLDQTVKHPIEESSSSPQPAPSASSTSQPMLMRKVTNDKKSLKSILKTSKRPIQSQLISATPFASTTTTTSDQLVRRVSLHEASEPSPPLLSRTMILSSHPPSRVSAEQQVATKKTPLRTPSTIRIANDRVTQLESEVCMLLVGMHKQQTNNNNHRPPPNPPQCVA